MQAMKWLRLWHEARSDAKLQSLADDEHRVWFNLLCFANEQPERGVIAGYPERLLAVEVARGDVALLRRTLEALVELRIIERTESTDALRFVAWEKRQRRSDDVNERVSNWRAQRRNSDVTLQQRYRNDGVTPQDREIERDRDTDPPTVSPSSNGRAKHPSLAPHDAARVSASEKPKPQKLEPTTRASPPPPSQPRPRDPIWDALVRVLEYEPRGKSERSNWGRVVHNLKEAEATPEQIVQAAKRWRLLYSDARLTINVFDGHWGELAERQASNGHQPTDPDAARAQELERVNHVLILRGEAPLEELPADYPTAGLVGQGPGRAVG